MKKIYTKLLTGIVCMLCTAGTYAQVTVTNPGNTTPGLAASYANLAAAITDLNLQTAIAGPVTITLDAANPQAAPAGGYAITATLAGGSSTNTVTLSGSNNIITAPTTHTAGALNDAIFKIIGSDFITIQGFTMLENAANTTTIAASNNMTEWGVALLYATTTNGAQNCTIQNNSITLNRIYQNTFGIYSSSVHTATAVGSGITATTAAGGNSGLKLYGNNISNVNNGIVVIGPSAATDHNTGIDIGGTSMATGNTISNYGTATTAFYFAVSGTLFGVLVRNSVGMNVSYNSITSANGGNTAGTLRGIYIPAFLTAPTGTFTNNFNNNTIAVTTGFVTGGVQGITIESTTGTATSTTNINGNNFTAVGYNVASPTGAASVIASFMGNLVTSISNNTFTNLSSTSTGSYTFISNGILIPAGGSQTINNNSIVTAFSKTAAGGTVTGITNTGFASTTVAQNWNNNNFSNITVTGATTLTFMNNTDGGTVNHNFIGNTFSNITGGSSAVTGIISNFGGGNGGSGNLVSGNTISNISSAGAITGIAIGSSGSIAISTVTGNGISGLTTTGASAVIGITSAAPVRNTISKNTICNLEANNASGTVSGIAVTLGTLHEIINNRIGDLRTPLANAANPLNGLNITGGTTVNVYFNSIHLNASSAGALFGSSAISTSTTPTLTLNNNIFVNTSTPAGATGFTVAYRRSTATLSTYTATSDRNLFYAGTPGINNLIHYDGTNAFQTLADYKAMTIPETLAPRDANSISEMPSFISTSCGADFLKINTGIPTAIESGGINIAGITDDFETQVRQGNPGYTGSGTAPDLGADEFDFGVVLPIAIEFFRGAKQTSGNLLDWKVSCTSSPYATLTVERSADGRSFSAINTQQATALRCQSPFSYTDAAALRGTNYYRLKMTDADGKTTYSHMVVIIGKEKGFEIVGLHPNPVQHAANLNLSAATTSKIILLVTDVNGRMMQKQSVQLQPGSNLVPLKVAALAAGSYQVTVMNEDGQKTSIRFVKQ